MIKIEDYGTCYKCCKVQSLWSYLQQNFRNFGNILHRNKKKGQGNSTGWQKI